MTLQTSRRRPRTVSCTVATPAPTCSSRGSIITTALSILGLLHSPQNIHAFTQPMRSSSPTTMRPQFSFTQMFYKSNDDIPKATSYTKNNPIRTKQPLYRLSQSEEVSLLQQMRSSPPNSPISQRARQTLLLHNLPLVQSIVTKILRSRPHLLQKLGDKGGGGRDDGKDVGGAALSKDDLLHEGTIGLAEAIDKYDLAYAQSSSPSTSKESATANSIIPKGARLGTYATYWIRARIIRAIQSREHHIRFPEHVLQASHRLVKYAREVELSWSIVSELADYDVITVKQKKLRDELRVGAGIKSDSLFREAVRVRTMSLVGTTTPLESWMSPSLDVSSAEQPSLEVEEEGVGQEHIVETLSKHLSTREVEVLSLRYGLVPSEEEAAVEETQEEQPAFRNYEAEAEEDLFGPNGMLSHYSDTPSDTPLVASVASTSKKSTSRIPSKFAPSLQSSSSKKKMTVTPNSTLLPFKEIGKRMQFSGEYCRRTCAVALEKLTRAVEEGRLAESDFLLGFS